MEKTARPRLHFRSRLARVQTTRLTAVRRVRQHSHVKQTASVRTRHRKDTPRLVDRQALCAVVLRVLVARRGHNRVRFRRASRNSLVDEVDLVASRQDELGSTTDVFTVKALASDVVARLVLLSLTFPPLGLLRLTLAALANDVEGALADDVERLVLSARAELLAALGVLDVFDFALEELQVHVRHRVVVVQDVIVVVDLSVRVSDNARVRVVRWE